MLEIKGFDEPPSPPQVRTQLERILASDVFRRSANLARFLRFVVEEEVAGRGHSIKESVIGVEAFARGEDFDPRIDPVVRVEARRLRAKLREYYNGSGQADEIIIDLPLGSYSPDIRWKAGSQPGEATIAPPTEAGHVPAPTHPATPRSRRSALLIGLGGITGAFGWLSWRYRAGPESIRSIAVVPFVNNAEPNEYLAHGLTETITNQLALLPDVRVLGQTTVARLKAEQSDWREWGRRLNVDAILTGALRISGGQLIVQAELLRTADGSVIWSQRFDRQVDDVFGIHEEIALEVARKLHGKPSTVPMTRNPKAYRHYVEGRYLWNKRTESMLLKASRSFEAALALEPRFALAWAGLADCYALMLPPQKYLHLAEQAVRTALEIDPGLAEAHTTLAHSVLQRKRRWKEAERSYRLAIERNPNYATARHWYALLLASRKRHGEALAQMRLAHELDPLSPIISTHVGLVRYFARDYDGAIEQYRRTLDLEPEFEETHYELGRAYAQLEQYDNAARQFQKVIAMSSLDSEAGAMMGYVYARTGRRVEAEKLLQTFLGYQKTGAIPAYYLAILYAGLGDAANAVQWLAESAKRGGHYTMYLEVEPVLNGVRDDPLFAALIRQLDQP
ncbi:MAG: tetratricopeptide repeat protein [Bryobacterales bacterium]|nr:tetratricopeptide repeat protein [Bryobacterales bacterium]